MIRSLSHLACAVLIFSLFACASNQTRGLEQVARGMDKDQVLSLAGDPQHVIRANDADHWIYEYTVDGHEWRRDVVFEKGHVAQVIRRQAKADWQKDLESADSMEEFEKKAREHQAEKSKGKFESVDGDGK